MNSKKEAGQKALDYHKAGFHCAEAVSKAVVEIYDQGMCQDIAKVATAFGGGIGRTHQEICGALTGGVIALGCLLGRNVPGADWTDASELAAELRRRFVREHGTTNCGALLAIFGPQEDMIRCKRLSGEVAGMVVEILEDHGKVQCRKSLTLFENGL
ncbi:MAG: C-GCAxxG-C-C family protein [Desulfobacterales bacterium]|jgi:C_GCAxxG_C_C family probable redox protein